MIDEALVTRLKRAIFSYQRLEEPTRRGPVETLLASLSETHAIVPKEEYEAIRKGGSLLKRLLELYDSDYYGSSKWDWELSVLFDDIEKHLKEVP